MTIIDLVGTPFPKDHPFFQDDKRLMSLVHKVESYIEMLWDLRDINLFLAQASFINTPEDVENIKIIHAPTAREAMVIAAIVGYGKLFKSATGRTVLKAGDVFPNGADGSHKFLIDLRDKFVAHQEWRANSHHLYYFKSTTGGRPSLNPNGYTVRTPVAGNVNVEAIKTCVSIVESHVQSRISSICESIQTSLNQDQIDYLNSDQPTEENPFHKKAAFTSRAKK